MLWLAALARAAGLHPEAERWWRRALEARMPSSMAET